MKFFYLYLLNILYCNTSEEYETLTVLNTYLNKIEINNIKNHYESYMKQSITIEDFYKELKVIIYIYYILNSTDIFQDTLSNLLKSVEDIENVSYHELIYYKLLIKKTEILNLVKNYIYISKPFLQKNYDHSNIYYNNLIITGKYINKIILENLFNVIKNTIHMEDLKKYLPKNSIIKYKITNKPLKTIIKNNGDFIIVISSCKFYTNNIYELEVFNFDNEIIANEYMILLTKHSSITKEVLIKLLNLNKVKYSYKNITVSSEDLNSNINNILSDKNINDKFMLSNQLIIMKSKNFIKQEIKNHNQDDGNNKIYDEIITYFDSKWIIIKFFQIFFQYNINI